MILTERDLARGAVADSMLAAQYQFVEYLQYRRLRPVEPVADILERRSRLGCLEGSASVIRHLAEKHDEKFDRLMIMTSRVDEGFAFDANPDWGGHAYFLARSNAGEWFAGSPANYRMTPESRHMTTVVSDPSLPAVLSGIARIDGGVWPTADFIEDAARAHYLKPRPSFGDTGYPLVEAFVVKREQGGLSHAYEPVSTRSGKNWFEEIMGRNMFEKPKKVRWA
jgi:hypothetical protein